MNLTSGTISCNIKTVGPAANRIAGNYIIPRGHAFEFSPATIVDGNFTESGPWDRNSAGVEAPATRPGRK